jgi:hypothetical protein
MKKLMAGAIGAAMMGVLPVSAFAACAVNDQQAEAELRKVEGIYGSDYGVLRRDMRQLRSAALILQRYGQEDACQEVVQTINEVLRDPRAAMTSASRTITGTDETADTAGAGSTGAAGAGTAGTDTSATGTGTTGTGTAATGTSEQTGSTAPAVTTMDERRSSAVPFAQSQRATSAAELIGSDVYGPNNESVGEIEDIIIGSGNQPGYAVISFGGFLGLGEEQVAVPLSAIRLSADDYLFVTFDRARLEAAPKIRRGSDDWLTDNEWRTQNDAYYTGNQ